MSGPDSFSADRTGASPDAADEAPGIRQFRFTAPPDSTTILLVRHGESAAAHPDRPFPLVDGHGDPPLAAEGVNQAHRLATRLTEEHHAGNRIDAIVVTTLRRTMETAAPTAAALGLEPAVEPDLREVFIGEWEGGAFRRHVAAGHPLAARLFDEERWDVIPGAESTDAFTRRVRAGLQRCAAAHRGGRVMVVTHGGVIGHLLHLATDSRPFGFSGADNASISELVVTPRRWTLRRFNDTTHLQGPGMGAHVGQAVASN